MSSLKLYYATVSTPSRAVLMAIRNFECDVEVITLNILTGEHKTGEFPEINPKMCVPTIVDGDFMLWESKAILMYLAKKYGGGGSFYPKCRETRALIHQRLLFDSTDFYARVYDVISIAVSPEPYLTQQHVEGLEKALQVMESFLEGHEYFVGDSLTIADFPFCASLTTLINFDFDISSYPNVSAWYEKMKEREGYDQCLSGAEELAALVKGNLKNSFEDFK